MNIRFMAQNHLVSSGFFRTAGSSFAPPPAWQNNFNRQNNQAAAPATNASIRTAGHHIQNALNNLQGRQSAFNVIEGRTSNADVATVTVDNARTIASVPPRNTTIDVRQAALAQANEGEALTANERTVDSGVFSFAIEAGGTAHTFNINVLDSDDNASIQRRMATAINAANMGVTATIATAGEGDAATTQLTLTASQTGTNSAFTVTDLQGGNLAASMGITEVSQEAQNAIFTINDGFERHAQTNVVSLAAGATATLQGEGRAEITFANDTEHALNAVTDLVNALNASLRNVNAGDGRGSGQFISDIRGMNQTFAPALSRVGIGVAQDGRLTIDEARFERAAQDGSLARMFSQNTGFVARAGRIAANAASSNHYRNTPAPVNFISPGNNFNFGNVNNTWSLMDLFW